VGTWRAQPPHIEIGYSAASPDHAVHPGTPERLSIRQVGTALAFVLVLGALTLAGHVLVWYQDGVLLRQAVDALGVFR
jgi:hypothetical protein